ncbi:ATP-binding protein [Gemmatimonas aurantiaca]|uniref:hybrid sensor histidine kinase/response regulator n=1 Tax=Gemmatimonas aurantiaca TaxID=173480 RepID=UPI00301C07AC
MAALLTFVGALLLGIAFDRWYRESLIERERERVRSYVAPYAVAIEGVFNRHVGRLAGLVAFVDAQPSVEAMRTAFPTIAEGLRTAATGLRAIQLNREGRIVATYPAADSLRLLGYDLLSDPRAEIRDGVQRAMDAEHMIITGPIALLQGGTGLILRQRVSNVRAGFPDLVTMVLDLGPVFEEADGAAVPATVRTVLLDRRGQSMRGEPADVSEPTMTPVRIGDGDWTVLASPVGGWGESVEADLRPTRAATLVIIVLLTSLAFGVVGREETLREAVTGRTRELARANDDLRREGEERLQLEERLLHSQKMEAVGTLAGGIAHDFNNLLTAIVGFAQLSEQQVMGLQNALAGSAESRSLVDLRQDLTEILKAADRASLLTAQLLAFSRRQTITPSRVNMNGIVHDIQRMLRRLIGEQVLLVTEATPQPLPVMADGGQLAQVVVNLVVNARDALPNGGTIRVTTTALDTDTVSEGLLGGLPAGQWVLLSVEDDGIGMPADIVARMWEPFFTTKQLGDGTGLGLSTVYGIVTQAGGHVFCDSTPGRGTTVTVALPRLAHTPGDVVEAPPVTGTSDGEVILVVEDEAGLRRLVSEILRRKGYQVQVAQDGADALEQLAAGFTPDLVLTDVVMPRMGGRELADAIVEHGWQFPVLFMSGYQAGEELPDDEEHAFIGKPFTPEALVSRVRKVLVTRI